MLLALVGINEDDAERFAMVGDDVISVRETVGAPSLEGTTVELMGLEIEDP